MMDNNRPKKESKNPSVVNKNLGSSHKQVISIIVKMWNSISDFDRKPYQDLAEADKERYKREKAQYVEFQKQQVDTNQSLDKSLQNATQSNNNASQSSENEKSQYIVLVKYQKNDGNFIYTKNIVEAQQAKEIEEMTTNDDKAILEKYPQFFLQKHNGVLEEYLELKFIKFRVKDLFSKVFERCKINMLRSKIQHLRLLVNMISVALFHQIMSYFPI